MTIEEIIDCIRKGKAAPPKTLIDESGNAFDTCPRCGNTIDAEYDLYCRDCGQKIGLESGETI